MRSCKRAASELQMRMSARTMYLCTNDRVSHRLYFMREYVLLHFRRENDRRACRSRFGRDRRTRQALNFFLARDIESNNETNTSRYGGRRNSIFDWLRRRRWRIEYAFSPE